MSAKPNYTKGQINALPLGPLKEALEALGIPFNGGKIAGRKSLKAALYPDTAAVSQPNPSQLSSSQPSLFKKLLQSSRIVNQKSASHSASDITGTKLHSTYLFLRL